MNEERSTENDGLDLTPTEAMRLGFYVAAFMSRNGEWDENSRLHGPEWVAECIQSRAQELVTPPAQQRGLLREGPVPEHQVGSVADLHGAVTPPGQQP